MNILMITVPVVPEYFNAGHRISMYLSAGFLREQGYSVYVQDVSALNATWRDIASLFQASQPDVICILNDFNLLDGFARLVDYARELTPHSKIITYGRLSSLIPDFFYKYSIDAVVVSGDYETGLASYCSYLNEHHLPAGVAVNLEDGWMAPLKTGYFLPPSQWVMPNPDEIHYSAYDRLYGDDRRKFCGIPERRELIVPIARGCPIACNFCEVWGREGLRERRLTVEDTLSYILRYFGDYDCEYVSFYAPTFTLKKKWVQELCTRLVQSGKPFPWKCTTTQAHLDQELIALMGKAGCVRISVGVESFEPNVLKKLPKPKMKAKEQFDEIHKWCSEANIELNAFVVVGLPGSTADGLSFTKQHIEQKGARFRPTIYSDYSLLKENMTERQAAKVLSRHFLLPSDSFTFDEIHKMYATVFGQDTTITNVAENIPQKHELK